MPPPPASGAPLGAPLLLVNLKAYPSALGTAALSIGRALQEEGRRRSAAVAISPAAPDLGRLAYRLSIPVLAQHVDPAEAGARTGTTVVESLAAAGVRGSLVNHSERPLVPTVVGETVERLRGADLVPVVCAGTVRAAAALARYRPPYLAIEPPELIGGTRSVSTARPEVISGAVRAVHRVSPSTRVLCGAGIHDRKDVALALALGSRGILVASAVALAQNPRTAIRELLSGF